MDINSLNFNAHNPDSNCIQCCKTMERMDSFLNTLEILLSKVNDPSSLDNLPPMLKMAMKMISK